MFSVWDRFFRVLPFAFCVKRYAFGVQRLMDSVLFQRIIDRCFHRCGKVLQDFHWIFSTRNLGFRGCHKSVFKKGTVRSDYLGSTGASYRSVS